MGELFLLTDCSKVTYIERQQSPLHQKLGMNQMGNVGTTVVIAVSDNFPQSTCDSIKSLYS
jgi:hypothetical protein